MRYLRACFNNYIGFYNGLGLNKVEIDFTKCKHNIILIIGINGCGKSTLMNSLNLFPDQSSSFIEGKDASKTLILSDNASVYEIHIISEADIKNGGRKTTKAFIKKNATELNPNGNVSSYKDIIFSEFDLDSNFISLSSLSSENRGLGDKTPAERKKFVSNIIDNLEVYNNIYKILNKKSIVFKSNLNNLHTKIQNIGQKDVVENKLTILKNKEASLNDKIVEANNNIVAIKAKNTLDENEVKEINNLSGIVNDYTNQLSLANSKLELDEHKTRIKREEVESKYMETTNSISEYSIILNTNTTEKKSIYDRITSINKELEELEIEAVKFKVDSNMEHIYKNATENIISIRESVKNSPPELVLEKLISIYYKFTQLLDSFYDGLTPDEVEFIVNNYNINTKSELVKKQQSVMDEINAQIQILHSIESDIKTKSILDNRPSNCKINTCPFIKDAVDIKDSFKTLEDKLANQNILIQTLSKTVSDIQTTIDKYDDLFQPYMKYISLRNIILDNQDLLSKYNNDLLTNYNTKLANLSPFNELRDTAELNKQLNMIKMYNQSESEYKNIESDYKIYRQKVEILNSNRAKTEKLTEEKTKLEAEFLSLKNTIDSIQETVNNLQSIMSNLSEYKLHLDSYNKIYSEYIVYKNRLDDYELKSAKALSSVKEIEVYKNQINTLSEELKPIVNDINIISGQLTLLDSYYNEYNETKQQYDLIETVKKYCSPTGGGIQTIFMQLYMKKTLDMSNDVLCRLFNGEYKLLDFIINEKEFRIPFVGNGLPVDDISSGSSSQISIMSMIINLVLLNQASTKYNIARLDEVDAGLDNRNRFEFINFLFYTMNILQIEQLFLISHSMEADNSNADIIRLKTYNDFESGIQSGNVIYDYRDNI